MQAGDCEANGKRRLMSYCLTLALIALCLASPVEAAQRELIAANWTEFQQQVGARKLENRTVVITSAAGEHIRTKLLAVADTGLVVRANTATKQWASSKKQALIPSAQIRSVRFLGHVGHRGLFTGLAAFGAGLGIGAALAASNDAFQITEGPAIIAVPAGIAAGAIGSGLAGFFIGRATSRLAPEFIIKP